MPLSKLIVDEIINYPAFKTYLPMQKIALGLKLRHKEFSLNLGQIRALFGEMQYGHKVDAGLIDEIVEDSKAETPEGLEAANQLWKILHNARERMDDFSSPQAIIKTLIGGQGPRDSNGNVDPALYKDDSVMVKDCQWLIETHVANLHGRVIEPEAIEATEVQSNLVFFPISEQIHGLTLQSRRPQFQHRLQRIGLFRRSIQQATEEEVKAYLEKVGFTEQDIDWYHAQVRVSFFEGIYSDPQASLKKNIQTVLEGLQSLERADLLNKNNCLLTLCKPNCQTPTRFLTVLEKLHLLTQDNFNLLFNLPTDDFKKTSNVDSSATVLLDLILPAMHQFYDKTGDKAALQKIYNKAMLLAKSETPFLHHKNLKENIEKMVVLNNIFTDKDIDKLFARMALVNILANYRSNLKSDANPNTFYGQSYQTQIMTVDKLLITLNQPVHISEVSEEIRQLGKFLLTQEPLEKWHQEYGFCINELYLTSEMPQLRMV